MTNELEKAIEVLKYADKKFPEKELKAVVEYKEEALPVLREAVKEAVREGADLGADYQLHFYALFLLGEFQDREFFPEIIEFVSLPGDTLEFLIGDMITTDLKDILYNTYNGNLALLKETAENNQVNEYVRADLLEVMGQLYLDGSLEEKEWKSFLKTNVHSGKEYNYFYDALALVICRCHFADMLPEIRHMLDEGIMDTMIMGEYDGCVDEMFVYREYQQRFCETLVSASERLRSWAMFEDTQENRDNRESQKAFEEWVRQQKSWKNTGVLASGCKVGRNDPCPCGSGKKYKFCCLNKPKSPLDSIESAEERGKCLEAYPYTGSERLDGRVYLEDCFDAESIEIDKLLYLGLANRPGLIWLRDERQEEKRSRKYLILAFEKFKEKTEKEGIKSFEEYDRRFSIHYFCEDWIYKLMNFLQEDGDEFYYEVRKAEKKLTEKFEP